MTEGNKPLTQAFRVFANMDLGFGANPHPENGGTAAACAALLAAQIEAGGDKESARALRETLKPQSPKNNSGPG